MTEQTGGNPKQGAVIGGWACVVIGTALMFWTLLSFLLYLPLFLAAFVLAIVAIAQRRLGHGIPMLLLSVAIPIVLGLGLGSYRMQKAMTVASASQTDETNAAAPSSSASATAANNFVPTAEQRYLAENVELYDFTAKYMESVLDGRVPGVTFKIKNKGDRSLDKVKVVVYFKDAGGSVIAEEEYFPVLVTEFNFSGDNDPLKPGYIWQQERGRFYSAKSVPSEWKEGAAEAKITEIGFTKNAP